MDVTLVRQWVSRWSILFTFERGARREAEASGREIEELREWEWIRKHSESLQRGYQKVVASLLDSDKPCAPIVLTEVMKLWQLHKGYHLLLNDEPYDLETENAETLKALEAMLLLEHLTPSSEVKHVTLRKQDLAKIFDCSLSTVARMISDNRLQCRELPNQQTVSVAVDCLPTGWQKHVREKAPRPRKKSAKSAQ